MPVGWFIGFTADGRRENDMAVVLKKKSTSECTCPSCGSLLGYDPDEDLYMGSDGKGFVCPECEGFVLIQPMAQTKWPDAFYHFGVANGAVCVGDAKIQNWIEECVDKLRKHDGLDYTYLSAGDTFVVVNWDDEDIVVRVCRDYYEAYVDGT